MYGDIHHIKLKDTYIRTKRSEDAEVQEISNTHMIVYRDSDMITKNSNQNLSQARCGFDRLNRGIEPKIEALEINDFYGIRHTRPVFDTFSKRALPPGCPTSKKSTFIEQNIVFDYIA